MWGVVAKLLLAALSLSTNLHSASAQGNSCPSGSYPDGNGECQTCRSIPNCAQTVCTGPYDSSCSSCATGFAGTTCQDCQPGYYKDDGVCRPCGPTPGRCTNGFAVCGSSATSLCQCPAGTYVAIDDGGYVCVECARVPHCALSICNGPGPSTCDRCLEGYTGPLCQTCTAGTYATTGSTPGVTECRACPRLSRCTATACSSPDDVYCVLCEKGFSGSTCSQCDAGYYLSGGRCQPCPAIPNCRTDPVCSTSGGSSCPLCKKGYAGAKCDKCTSGYFAKGKSCLACPRLPACPSATTCTSPDNARCSDCPVPGSLPNGVVTGSYQEGDKITYKCNAGYELSGLSTRTCLNGQWTGTRPQCVRDR